MATITTTISPIPDAGHRGIDARTEFVNKQEAFQDALTDVFVGQINALTVQLNSVVIDINQSEANAKAYQDTSKIYRDESLSNKNLSLVYKNETELAYNNTQTLLSTLVIPTQATYNYQSANAKFEYKTDTFLNFRIGE